MVLSAHWVNIEIVSFFLPAGFARNYSNGFLGLVWLAHVYDDVM